MYRQATGMLRSDVHVLTLKYQNPDRFPPNGVEVSTVDAERVSRVRWQRYVQYARNWKTGFFRGTRSELEWWTANAKAQRPAVALCHYGTTAARMAPLFKKLGIPVVVHFNGFDLPRNPQDSRYIKQLRAALGFFSGFVVVAPHMREWLLRHNVPNDKIRFIPYGVPVEQFSIAHVQEQPCQFLAVGRLVEKKRPDLTLRAFAKCASSTPDIQLTLAGDGPLHEECVRLAQELGVANSVTFLGSCSPEQVKQQLAKASVFVQHSVTASNGDMEGWPVAIAEAAASGLPIVSTRHASIPQQVEHGVSGFLSDERDWATMAENLRRLAIDPALRKTMGQAARSHISNFDTSRQIALLEDYLHEVARSASPQRSAQ